MILQVEDVRDVPDTFDLVRPIRGDFVEDGFYRIGIVSIDEEREELVAR